MREWSLGDTDVNDRPAFRPHLGLSKEECDLHKRLQYLLDVVQSSERPERS